MMSLRYDNVVLCLTPVHTRHKVKPQRSYSDLDRFVTSRRVDPVYINTCVYIYIYTVWSRARVYLYESQRLSTITPPCRLATFSKAFYHFWKHLVFRRFSIDFESGKYPLSYLTRFTVYFFLYLYTSCVSQGLARQTVFFFFLTFSKLRWRLEWLLTAHKQYVTFVFVFFPREICTYIIYDH